MKAASTDIATRISRRAYTLMELSIATAVGSVVAGSVLLLLWQTAMEQRNGFADTTVEERAYTLEADITTCLRGMSANQGFTPDYSSGLYDASGNFLGYQSVFIFYPSNGSYIAGNISFHSSSGTVIYTTNILNPSAQQVWMSNSPAAVLTELCFSTSLNLDGSKNSSLVNVSFQMNDNGFSQQNPINNPTSIYRNFSVQMRNDN